MEQFASQITHHRSLGEIEVTKNGIKIYYFCRNTVCNYFINSTFIKELQNNKSMVDMWIKLVSRLRKVEDTDNIRIFTARQIVKTIKNFVISQDALELDEDAFTY